MPYLKPIQPSLLIVFTVLGLLLVGCSDTENVTQTDQKIGVVTPGLTPKHYASFEPRPELSVMRPEPVPPPSPTADPEIDTDVFVLEFFSYACTRCQSFGPKLDDATSVEYVPVIWDDVTRIYARLFYAIRTRADFHSLHMGLFEQVAALDAALSSAQRQVQLMKWLQQQGVPPSELSSAMESEANQVSLRRVKALMKRFSIIFSPALVIAGELRYPSNKGPRVRDNDNAAGQGLDDDTDVSLDTKLGLQRDLSQPSIIVTDTSSSSKKIFQVRPGQGELLIYTEPFVGGLGVEVSIDGKAVGIAPYKTELTPGVHQIEVMTIDGQRSRMEYTIRHGELETLRFDVKTSQTATSGLPTSDGTSRSYTVDGVDFKLVKIPAGSFKMGSNSGYYSEKPVHRVNISRFYMMETEVTKAAFAAFVKETGYSMSGGCWIYNSGWEEDASKNWQSPGFSQSSQNPVVCVNWKDATEFAKWLSRKTGKTFRLPSESEWEYAARAGSTSKYSWGDSIGRNKANCDGCGSQWDNSKTAPVKSFRPNAFGLYDMHGNVWEWTQDCWNESYNGAPGNNRAWESGDCERRVLRGGSWFDEPTSVRSANRSKLNSSSRNDYFGFRLVQAP